MPGTSFRLLQVLLWGVCAFHVIVGLGLNLSSGFLGSMASYYGARLDASPDFAYIVKPLGMFMLALGTMAAAAARNPIPHAAVVYGFVILFVGRALQRFFFRQEIHDVFAIDAGRNVANAVFFLALAAVLFMLYRYVARQRSGA